MLEPSCIYTLCGLQICDEISWIILGSVANSLSLACQYLSFWIPAPFVLQMIDRNSDGKLDLHDFALQGTITNVHYQKWTELRDKFDYDGDGMITMDEVSVWRLRDIGQALRMLAAHWLQGFKGLKLSITSAHLYTCAYWWHH